MKIQSKTKDYEVVIQENRDFFRQLAEMPNAEFVIDAKVYNLYKEDFSKIPENRLYLLEATEQNKIIDSALDICEKITEIPAKRNAVLISIGGGIIQDVTGFAANIIYRGINWTFVPTTLLSACDSCIGGKTSLNYKKYKNLLGTFFPPNKIYICSQLFRTLSEKDYKSGLGEVIKFNIMAGKQGMERIEKNLNELLERDEYVINSFVESSLLFKKTYIEIDEFDTGERIKLNFAHTFGHAIEAITNYEIPHGTAVAIGMIMANCISESRGWLSKDIAKRIELLLLKVIDIDIKLLNKPLQEYMNAMRKDKKQVGNSLTAVLISKYEDVCELSVVHDVAAIEVENAINYFIELYEDKV